MTKSEVTIDNADGLEIIPDSLVLRNRCLKVKTSPNDSIDMLLMLCNTTMQPEENAG